jgi:ATP-dependent DNA helicase RecQ
MSTFLTPESPLGLAVQQLLLEERRGLTVPEIRRRLRQRGKVAEERSLRELLAHPRIFTGLSGDRFSLVDGREDGVATAADEYRGLIANNWAGREADVSNLPYLVSLPRAASDYVVLDLETTGLDPGRDRIIQLVAIRYRGGRPVSATNDYFSPGPVAIPYTVQVKIGLTRHPEIQARVDTGGRLDDVADRICAFLGDDPIVTHNVRFDRGFLDTALGPLPNLFVDTMELALLACPGLSSHRLNAVACALGVDVTAAATVWSQASDEPPDVPIDEESLHNAVTDTALLAATYRALLDRLYEAPEDEGPALRLLLPELRGGHWGGIDEAALDSVRVNLKPVADDGPATPASLLPDDGANVAASLLDRHARANGLSERPGQRAMLDQVQRSLDAGRFALIEAPTGTGKTLAYLLPALAHACGTGQAVVVTTAYRNLQDQLVGEVASLRASLGLPFESQVLKGRANYACHRRLFRYLELLGPEASLAERFVLAHLLGKALVQPDWTLDDVTYWCVKTFPIARGVMAAIGATGGCGGKGCRAVGCPLERASAGAQRAHLVLVNHALWLSESGRLPSFDTLIVDEAHALEDAATSAWTREVSRAALEALFDRLLDEPTNQGALLRLLATTPGADTVARIRAVFPPLRRLRPLVQDFGRHLIEYVRTRDRTFEARYGAQVRLESDPRRVDGVHWTRVEGARMQLFDLHLGDLLARLAELAEAVDGNSASDGELTLADLRAIREELAEQQRLHDEILQVRRILDVNWIELGPEAANQDDDDDQTGRTLSDPDWALKCAPIRVGPELARRYEDLRACVLTSATLSIRGGDFSFFVDRLGLGERLNPGDVRAVDGDLDYASNALLGLAAYLQYTPLQRTIQSFQEELARELEGLLELSEGRALVLFTARSRLEEVYRRCSDALGQKAIPVLAQLPGASRRQLQEDFRETRESVLFGLQSFWEGIDVPGESLSFVVMERLPFPFLFDPVIQARGQDVAERGGREFDDYLFPLMAIRFKQGFGRLLRRRGDRGAVILMDRRIHRKPYRHELLASLPGHMPRDEDAERSRPAFYRMLAERLPDVITRSVVERVLMGLPPEHVLDLAARLAELALPPVITDAEYEQWRPTLLTALREVFGFEGFRGPEQEQVIRAMLTGRDVLALLPTGAGKSLCFQLPALLRDGVTVVFSPLIALMRDQVDNLNDRGIELVGAIYSGQSADERESVLERMRRGTAKLVYIAPERIRDPLVLGTLERVRISQVVVDEAHCVALWGPTFRPDYLYLPRLTEQLPSRPPIAAFTATATLPMRREISTALAMREPIEVTASFDRPELRLVVYNASSRYNRIRSKRDRLSVLLRIVEAAARNRAAALVYVTTTVEADRLARWLEAAGFVARAYHGKMDTADRASVQELFMDDQLDVVVCTKAFGMGIDKPNIRYVVHAQMPGDVESYFQEAGRAGRDGEAAYCILLQHPSDRGVHDYFIEEGQPDPALLEELAARLRAKAGEIVHLDTESLRETLGVDDVKVRIGLHLLEQAGQIERGPDFTVRGALTLLRDVAVIKATLAPADSALAALFVRAVSTCGWTAHRRIELDLPAEAVRLGISPEMLDALLVRLAIDDLAIYRPWERGAVIRKLPALVGGGPVVLPPRADGDDPASKLDRMVAYAEAGEREGCRRARILRYFGEAAASGGCGACDACAPETAFPWSHIAARDVADPSAYVDPAFTLLQVVHWNLDQRRRGQNPYGTGTLLNVLAGNAYLATRSLPDPHLRRWRLDILRGCPYWGIFETLPRRDETVDRVLGRLRDEGYVGEQTTSFEGHDGHRTYTYPILLARGRDQLASGELLRWQ